MTGASTCGTGTPKLQYNVDLEDYVEEFVDRYHAWLKKGEIPWVRQQGVNLDYVTKPPRALPGDMVDPIIKEIDFEGASDKWLEARTWDRQDTNNQLRSALGDNFIQDVQDDLKDTTMWMEIDSNILTDRMMPSGRFKNMHENKRPYLELDVLEMTDRQFAEWKIRFQVEQTMTTTLRQEVLPVEIQRHMREVIPLREPNKWPKYGYLDNKDEWTWTKMRNEGYGDGFTRIVFKQSVRRRSTVTPMDSFKVARESRMNGFAFSPANELTEEFFYPLAKIDEFDPEAYIDLDAITEWRRTRKWQDLFKEQEYIEVQAWGDLDFSDVARIETTSLAKKRQLERGLKRNGIKNVEVVPGSHDPRMLALDPDIPLARQGSRISAEELVMGLRGHDVDVLSSKQINRVYEVWENLAKQWTSTPPSPRLRVDPYTPLGIRLS